MRVCASSGDLACVNVSLCERAVLRVSGSGLFFSRASCVGAGTAPVSTFALIPREAVNGGV